MPIFSSCLRYYYRNPYVKIIVEEWSAGSKKPAEAWDLFNETDDMESRYLATCAATLDFVIVVSSKSDPSKDDSHVQVCSATILLPHLSHFISGHCHRSLRCVLSFFLTSYHISLELSLGTAGPTPLPSISREPGDTASAGGNNCAEILMLLLTRPVDWVERWGSGGIRLGPGLGFIQGLSFVSIVRTSQFTMSTFFRFRRRTRKRRTSTVNTTYLPATGMVDSSATVASKSMSYLSHFVKWRSARPFASCLVIPSSIE